MYFNLKQREKNQTKQKKQKLQNFRSDLYWKMSIQLQTQ